MKTLTHSYQQIELRTVEWMAAHGIRLLRVSLGIVFLWFGALKFVPRFSPAEELASATIVKLTLGTVAAPTAVLALAFWETLIGLALVLRVQLRIALGLLFVQLVGTLTPLVLFPSLTFTKFPFAPTMEGQYILKNMVLMSAAIVIGATMRGGRLVGHTTRAICCGRDGTVERALSSRRSCNAWARPLAMFDELRKGRASNARRRDASAISARKEVFK
jgi:uncharacterized membrane protein YkgB